MATEDLPREGAAAEPRVPIGPEAVRARDADVGAAEAASLVARLGGVLGDLARDVDALGAGLAPTLVAAAERDPALVVQAQALDAVSQSLHSLAGFLAEVGRRRVGREPLHLEVLASALPLKALADRLSGLAAEDVEEDVLFA